MMQYIADNNNSLTVKGKSIRHCADKILHHTLKLCRKGQTHVDMTWTCGERSIRHVAIVRGSKVSVHQTIVRSGGSSKRGVKSYDL